MPPARTASKTFDGTFAVRSLTRVTVDCAAGEAGGWLCREIKTNVSATATTATAAMTTGHGPRQKEVERGLGRRGVRTPATMPIRRRRPQRTAGETPPNR